MANDKRIKDINRKWVYAYIFCHIIIFSIFVGVISPAFSDVEQLLSKLKSPSGFLPLILYPLAIIFDGLLSDNMKHIIVFRRIKDPLPGMRAFSYIADKDPRIDFEKIKILFPQGIPTAPKDQNTKWYSLFEKYEDIDIIRESHKLFLLTRDFAALTLIFLPICIVGHFFWNSPLNVIIYHTFFLLFLFVGISISAKHYGEAFVANVLVEATR